MGKTGLEEGLHWGGSCQQGCLGGALYRASVCLPRPSSQRGSRVCECVKRVLCGGHFTQPLAVLVPCPQGPPPSSPLSPPRPGPQHPLHPASLRPVLVPSWDGRWQSRGCPGSRNTPRPAHPHQRRGGSDSASPTRSRDQESRCRLRQHTSSKQGYFPCPLGNFKTSL